MSASSCASVGHPPYSLAFAFDGGAPRLIEASRESTVPLIVTNTGTRAWDPGAIHLSYHWLWLVPRELVRRSRWNLPYHDGIRTDLQGVVAPGARVSVEARLLAPTFPGVYWLQWDMVEENVAWFAQTSPRQPRRLVVVLPTAADLFAPLPLAVALAGLFALAFTRQHGHAAAPLVAAFAATADVWWCVATLFSKQMLLVSETLLEPTPVAYWLAAVAAIVPPLVVMLVLPRRVRAWVLFAIGVLGTAIVFADVIYYRFFGDVVSAPAILAAHQTGRVLGSIRSLLTPGLTWTIVDLPFTLALVMWLSRSRIADVGPRRERIAAASIVGALVVAGIALSAPVVIRASDLDQMFRNRAVVEQLGPFGYHAYDLWNYARATVIRPAAADREIDDARAWFAARAPLRRGVGQAFGLARGRNIVVIQVESLQDFVVDFRVGGQDVMPHLRRWSADSVRFTNVTDQTSEGRTSDAEFTTLASLLPLDHGAVAFRYPENDYVGVPRILTDAGYTTLSAVAFEPGFWNRAVMHPAYGFQRSLFEPDFVMTEQIGWGLNDRDFLQQMVPRLERLRPPFLAWLITLSLHHPFDDFPARHKVLKLGALEGTSFGNYLHTMRFFDEALEDFKTALARNGLLEKTMIVVFGDHDAGFAHTPSMARAIGIADDDASWALVDRIPWFIRPPDGEDLPHAVDRPAGQTDFGPTLLALAGIDPAPLPYVGRNMFGEPDDPPLPRPYGDWIDTAHVFVSHGVQHSASCFDRRSRARLDAAACAGEDSTAKKERDVSRLVIVNGLQKQLRASLVQSQSR